MNIDIIFGEVELHLPKTIEAIVTARNLLALVEDEIVCGWVCKHCGCTENIPCPGGCSWVAPNLCSRCAETERTKPETLQNISPPRETVFCGCGDELRTLEDLEYKVCGVCRSLKKDVVMQGNEAGQGVEKSKLKSCAEIADSVHTEQLAEVRTDEPFLFQECEPFKWFGLPTFRAGKTMYHLQQGMIHIMREGYGDVPIYVARDDLKYLYKYPDAVKTATSGLYENKRYILKGFLHDVEFSKIGCDEHRKERGLSNRRAPLTEEESNEMCPACGHRRGLHHNPDDRCCESGCDCGYYFYGQKVKKQEAKELSKEIPQNTQNDVKCPKCGKSDYSKWGTKKTRVGTKYQYYCKPCGKVFSSDLDVGRKNALPKKEAVQTQSQVKDQLLNDPDRAYKPFGLNKFTKTGGDGERIEQEYVDELAAPGANA